MLDQTAINFSLPISPDFSFVVALSVICLFQYGCGGGAGQAVR